MKTKYKHIEIIADGNDWQIKGKPDASSLGIVYYCSGWKKWGFGAFTIRAIQSEELSDIADFMSQLDKPK